MVQKTHDPGLSNYKTLQDYLVVRLMLQSTWLFDINDEYFQMKEVCFLCVQHMYGKKIIV